ncbi:transposase [Candidatus Bipolaricaulota bacterium]|nr:transposase [Candidatus Bipolaricaulota bacterium]
MARPLRIEYPGAVYHVTSRGNAQQDIFADDHDREAFLEVLAHVIDRFEWLCHAYCLMSNHYHLLIETPSPDLSRGMQLLNGVYTQRFNRQHKRSGHVFQGRFKAILVEKESHLLELARYVVLNPVRAKMVRSARDWPWSSYRATSGQVEAPQFLAIDWILSQLEAKRGPAIRAYRRFVAEGGGVNAWNDLRAGSLLGSEAFIERMRPVLLNAPLDPNILRRERDAARPSLAELFADVSDKPTRDERIHEAVLFHHYKLREVAKHTGLHFSTISVIAKRVAEAKKIRK